MASDKITIIGLALFWLVAVAGELFKERYRRYYWAAPASAIAFGASGLSMGAVWALHGRDNATLLSPDYPNVVLWVGIGFLGIGSVLVVLGLAGLCFRRELFNLRLKWHVRQWRNEKRFNEWCNNLTPLEHHELMKNVRYMERQDLYMQMHGVERWRIPTPVSLTASEMRSIARAPVSAEAGMTSRERLAARMRAKYFSPKSWLRNR